MQPLIAKLILPWFGGSAAVWTSCMLFFQMALLGGYAYAHWLNGQRGPAADVHPLGLLALSFLFAADSALRVVEADRAGKTRCCGFSGCSTATVGLPYFLLVVHQSAAAIVVFARERRRDAVPVLRAFECRLHAGAADVSGAGGALSDEPAAGVDVVGQLRCVRAGLRGGGLAFARRRMSQKAAVSRRSGPPPDWSERLIWMGLAACASALLLAVTNHLTQNMAAIPFLWVLPLSLYLLSFILCFDSDRWYRRWLFTRLGAVALPAMAYAISDRRRHLRI